MSDDSDNETLDTFSIVSFTPGCSGEECGYCKSKSGSYSDGMWVQSLHVGEYQELVDRGWRRCGQYFYKPDMQKSCCPAYTIRCRALEFEASKSQKKVLKRISKFLENGSLQRARAADGAPSKSGDSKSSDGDLSEILMIKKAKESINKKISYPNILKKNNLFTVKLDEKTQDIEQTTKCQVVADVANSTRTETEEAQIAAPADDAAGVTGPNHLQQCRKAKVVRRERWAARLASKGLSVKDARAPTLPPASLEQLLPDGGATNPKAHKLQIKLILSDMNNKEFFDSYEESYQLYKKYQMQIHNEPEEECGIELYKQAYVHSPLKPHAEKGVILGLFHQQYWLDGRLIAVGVVDLLPCCVSSVYFYYDSDLSFLSLGTFSALREIGLVRELVQRSPRLQFYYMGFYIHSCVKMRYKSQFSPSLLLCPASLSWHSIEQCCLKLEADKYCVFQQPAPTQLQQDPQLNLDQVHVLDRHTFTAMTYGDYKKRSTLAEGNNLQVGLYMKLVGCSLAKRLLLVLPPA